MHEEAGLVAKEEPKRPTNERKSQRLRRPTQKKVLGITAELFVRSQKECDWPLAVQMLPLLMLRHPMRNEHPRVPRPSPDLLNAEPGFEVADDTAPVEL